MKKVISLLLCASLLFGALPIHVFAVESEDDIPESEDIQTTVDTSLEETNSLGELGGYLAGNALNTASLYADRKFTSQKWGFAFAAENGNNLVDQLKGLNATVVGDNNAKDGPDRIIVNRGGETTLVQTKYHQNAAASVADAFDGNTGLYRYVDGDGKPMQLEVPRDQYDDAIRLMRKRIEAGKVPGVSDPEEAANLIRKGNLTFKQAQNIAKAGNIDSLMYDATKGVINASCAAGISFVVDYACCRINGLDNEGALKNACYNGIKTGGTVFATYVISSQLAKAGLADSLAKALIPTAEAITKTFGDDVCKAILQRAGAQGASAATANQVASALARELLADGVLLVVLTSIDVANLFQGRISKEEVLKNLTVTIVSIAAGTAGGIGGATLGSLIAPGFGTTIGAILGSVTSGAISALVAEALIAPYYESDAEEMFAIISDQFTLLCSDYLASTEEADQIVEALKNELVGDILKDMYAAEDREQFARDLIEPLFVDMAEQRSTIITPTKDEIRYSMKEEMQGIIFIH